MKIITLHQPYASLVAYGLKSYETRSWATKYRGPLAIHAAKRPFVSADGSTIKNHDYYKAWQQALKVAEVMDLPLAHNLPLGAVVAIANLKSCLVMKPHLSCHPGIAISSQTKLERSLGNWEAGNYAWQLSQVQRLATPVSHTGAQGMRNVAPELSDAIAAALS